MRPTRPFLLLLLAVSLVIAACGGDETPPPPTQTPAPTPSPTAAMPPSPTPLPTPLPAEDPGERTQLRVVHASPDLPSVSIYLDGANIGGGFKAGSYHQSPVTVRAGEYLLRVVETGENPDVTPRLIEQRITLSPQRQTVIVLAGQEGNYRLILAEEDLSPLSAQITRLNVINALPGNEAIALQEANRTLETVPAGAAAPAPLELVEGDHPLQVLQGTSPVGRVDFYGMARHAYTLVLFPAPDSGELQSVTFRSRVVDVSQVRVAHVSPDLEPVDVYLDDTLLAENLAYRSASEWSTHRSTNYTLRVVPAGDPDAEPVLQRQVTLRPDEAANLVLLDTRDRLRVALVEDDLSPTPSNAARLTFVHAAVDVIQVAIHTYGGEIPGIRPISFGTATHPIPYAAGLEAFFFETGSGDDLREIDFLPERNWQAGFAYTILITDTPNEPPVVLETSVGMTSAVLTDEGIVSEETTAGVPPATTEGRLSIRLLNVVSGAEPIDFLVDGEPVFEAVSFGTATAYHTFIAPPQHILVRSSTTGATLIDTDVTFDAPPEDTWITVYIFRDTDGVLYELASDVPIAIPDGQTLLRVFHAAPEKPLLKIEREETGTMSGETSGAGQPVATPNDPEPLPPQSEEEALGLTGQVLVPVAEQLPFGQASDPLFVPAGVYRLVVLEHETGFTVVTLPEYAFESRTMVELVLLPDASGLSVEPLFIRYEETP